MADAWGDAGDIIEQYSYTVDLGFYAMEIAQRTSLTQPQAEVNMMNSVQQAIGDLLYLYGDYSKGEDE